MDEAYQAVPDSGSADDRRLNAESLPGRRLAIVPAEADPRPNATGVTTILLNFIGTNIIKEYFDKSSLFSMLLPDSLIIMSLL